MTSLKDLPQSNLLVLLAPRFDLNEGGHFYWYTKEIVAELNLHHPKYLVLSPPLGVSEEPDFIDSRWKFIEDFSAWGNDLGTKSPKELVKRISPLLNDLDKSENITILSFESSFSMLVALLEIQRRIPNIQVSVTLLDHGFWIKLLSTKLPLVKLLVSNFIRILGEANSVFKLLHPSLSQAASFSRLLGFQVFSFSHISAFWKYSAWPLKIETEEIRLLVLPWSVDLDHVLEFVNSSSSRIGLEFNLHIHFKNDTDLTYFRKRLDEDLFSKIEYTAGVLSQENYISQFKRTDLAWIPYTDFYHQITGSGRAFDCLALGCPLIIDEKSDLALMVAGFPLVYFCPDNNNVWISRFLDQIMEEKKDFQNYVGQRSKLEDLGARLFSPLNGIDSYLAPFNPSIEKSKVTFKFTDFLSLEILFYFGLHYSKLNQALVLIRSIPNLVTRVIRKSRSHS